MVQALRRLQRDGHLPTDASTRLHFSRDELSTYLESEDGQSRAARTRLQWAKLLEAPTLLVVALRRGRRVAQLGPRSPDYLSEDDVYASLADLRSRRLAEMAAHCVEIQISGAPRHRRDVVPVRTRWPPSPSPSRSGRWTRPRPSRRSPTRSRNRAGTAIDGSSGRSRSSAQPASHSLHSLRGPRLRVSSHRSRAGRV